jgi:IclR family transcriptional regulator, KDG regulon repressor
MKIEGLMKTEGSMKKEDSMQTISRAIQVLKAFTFENKGLSLADLHQKLGISKSSLQRILKTLDAEGFLERNERQKSYELGLELYFLGQLVEADSHLLSIAKPNMEKLSNETGESITLNIIHDKKRKCIGHVQGKHELTTLTHIGQYSPLYAGASAKVLFAFLPDQLRNQLLNEMEFVSITANTVVDKNNLRAELLKIREQGYATSEGERVLGAFSFCAPITNRFNEIIASLSITMPVIRVGEEISGNYVIFIKDYARQISTQLGGW